MLRALARNALKPINAALRRAGVQRVDVVSFARAIRLH